MPWLFAVILTVSCSSNRTIAPKSLPLDHSNPCAVVTNAIDNGDWDTLRSLAKPGTRANDCITMWENSQRLGHALRVGRLIRVERDVELNGKPCTKYSFVLESKDGAISPHELQILVRDQAGQSEILDFWNFGW